MNYYIWNKRDSILGLSAMLILSSRLDFKDDDVIVIHDKNDKNKVVMIETKEELRKKYDIQSTDPNVIGFIVSTILETEPVEYLKHIGAGNDDKDNNNENNDDVLKMYSVEDIMNKPKDVFIPKNTVYREPGCKVLNKEKNNDEQIMNIKVELHHVLSIEPTNILEPKYMDHMKELLEELENKRMYFEKEGNIHGVENIRAKLNEFDNYIIDESDLTILLNVEAVYMYDDIVTMELDNGQFMMIQREAIESMRTHSLEYFNSEGIKNKDLTVIVELNELYNDILERGNTVFIVAM